MSLEEQTNDNDNEMEVEEENTETQKKPTKEELLANTPTIRMFPIPPNFTEINLFDLFSKTSKPIDMQFSIPVKSKKTDISNMNDESKKKKALSKVAFVTFKNNEEVQKIIAIAEDNKIRINEKETAWINPSQPARFLTDSLRNNTKYCMFTNIEPSLNEQSLLDFIKEKCKKIKSPPVEIVLSKNRNSNKYGLTYQNYACIKFATNEDCTECVENCRFQSINNQKIFAYFRMGRKDPERCESLAKQTKELVIFNVPSAIETEEDFKNFLNEHELNDKIEEIIIFVDKYGYPVHRARISFEDIESANNAFEKIHGLKCEGLTLLTAYSRGDNNNNNNNNNNNHSKQSASNFKKKVMQNPKIKKTIVDGNEENSVSSKKLEGATSTTEQKIRGRGRGRGGFRGGRGGRGRGGRGGAAGPKNEFSNKFQSNRGGGRGRGGGGGRGRGRGRGRGTSNRGGGSFRSRGGGRGRGRGRGRGGFN